MGLTVTQHSPPPSPAPEGASLEAGKVQSTGGLTWGGWWPPPGGAPSCLWAGWGLLPAGSHPASPWGDSQFWEKGPDYTAAPAPSPDSPKFSLCIGDWSPHLPRLGICPEDTSKGRAEPGPSRELPTGAEGWAGSRGGGGEDLRRCSGVERG